MLSTLFLSFIHKFIPAPGSRHVCECEIVSRRCHTSSYEKREAGMERGRLTGETERGRERGGDGAMEGGRHT